MDTEYLPSHEELQKIKTEDESKSHNIIWDLSV